MKLIPSTFLVAAFLAWFRLNAQGIPVIDASAVAQAIEAVRLATQQLEQAKTELERLGDPSRIRTPAADQLLQSLSLNGAGRTLLEIQQESTGSNGTTFNANGLYRTPTEVLQTAGGTVVPRAVEEYRKYDAVDQAVKTLEDVMYDTEERRQGLRKQIDQALRELQKATTIAETQKLQGLLSALNAELGAVDRERDTALSRVIVQGIYNQTDAARQQQARREDTEASVRQATDKLAENLKVDTSPIRIPSPALR